jgi:ABC-type multidrug transport system fused ATPase/permease subunit
MAIDTLSPDDSSLHEILKKASLDEFVATLPDGLDTRVGESGIKLSGGQRQRLAIARALLKKSKVILFDESTSSLDNHTQEDIKQSIAALRGHTVIIVAHRLSTIKDCDTIFFIEGGNIAAQGTYAELRATNKNFNAFFLAEQE